MAGSRFTLETIFKGKDYVSKSINKQIRLQRKLNTLRSRSEKQMKSAMMMQSAMSKGFMATGAAAGVAAVGVWKLTEAGREFDSEMSKVQAAMGKVTWDDDMDRLRVKAAELGATTEFTSAQAAAGMVELAKAGFTAEQSIGAIGSVLSGASAGELEMSEAAAILTSTMAGFGLKSKDMAENTAQAQRVMDVLAVASTKTKSSISTLGESLKSVSPVAKQFGFSLEESVAMVAKMQDVGIEASEAGNAVKTMLTKLTAGGGPMKKTLDELGVSFVDAYGNMKPPAEIFAEANKLKAGLEGNAAQAKAFADIVGLRGQKALTVLSDSFSDAAYDGKTLVEVLENSKGAADQMAKTKLDNLNGDVVKLGSAWDGLRVQLTDALKGGLRPMVQQFTDWLSSPEVKEGIVKIGTTIKSWIPPMIETVTILFNIAAAIWEVVDAVVPWEGTIKTVLAIASAVWLVTTAIKAWTAATAIFNAVMMLNPVVALMMAIVAAIALVIMYWDEFKIAGLMALDALAAPAIFLYNKIVDINRLFGGTMEKLEYMQATDAAIAAQDREANFAAMDAARAQRGSTGGGGGGSKVSGEITVKASPGTQVTAAKKTGPVGLSVPKSGGF